MLDFLRQTLHRCPQHLKERPYKATVHPKLEYCSSIWDPHQQKYINKLERTQCRATRFVKNVSHCRDISLTSVTATVHDLCWESLLTHSLHHRLTMLYRVINGLLKLQQEYYPTPRNHSTCEHSKQFQHFQQKVYLFKYAFLPRTISDCNVLPTSWFWYLFADEWSMSTLNHRSRKIVLTLEWLLTQFWCMPKHCTMWPSKWNRFSLCWQGRARTQWRQLPWTVEMQRQWQIFTVSRKSARANATYQLADIQNALISVVGSLVRESIIC